LQISLTTPNLSFRGQRELSTGLQLQEKDQNHIAKGGGTFFKVGGTSARQKSYRKLLWFELATVTSQALKYDVITYAPHEGLNYAILDKITPVPSPRGAFWGLAHPNKAPSPPEL